MDRAILFKIMQRKYKFRNPKHLLGLATDFVYTENEYESAKKYILSLKDYKINYSYPEDINYPLQFLKMKEPPLFFEYYGEPVWQQGNFLAIVGSREMHQATESWLKQHLPDFLMNKLAGVVSGGARGVDQLAHIIAIKNQIPTIFVLPSGLLNLYPKSLEEIRHHCMGLNVCFISEFELQQRINKSHFYFRNRLIAAIGEATLVAQASLKSGSLLTVHHSLEMGKSVLTVPAHPEMQGFDGNLKLLFDGAYSVRNSIDLLDFWKAESWSN
jgi:DNA processing protein